MSILVKFPGGLQESPEGLFQVDVDHIEPYDGNARLVPNTKREELKRITLRDGAPPGQLVVTRRPGSQQLVLARGGNTRLAIVKELHREHPDDPRWTQIAVRYETFVSELQLAVNSLQENDARGELLFIEKAFAFRHVYDLWKQAEPDPETATTQNFIRFFAAFGKPPEKTAISYMLYAVETLYQVIPTALVAGQMTRNAIRRLIEYRNKIGELWVAGEFGERAEFEDYFHEHLRRLDRELAATAKKVDDFADEPATIEELQIDYRRLSDALAHEMAQVEHVTASETRIRGWIDEILGGTPVETILAPDPAASFEYDQDDLEYLGLNRQPPLDLDAYDTEDISDLLREENARKREQEVQRIAAASAPKTAVTAAAGLPTPLSAASCRDNACAIACRIAARHCFSKLVLPFDAGIGYLIADTIVQGDDEPVPLAQAAPWWVLVVCGQILDLPAAIADARLPEESLLRAAIVGRQVELIAHVMGPPASFGRCLGVLGDLDMADFMALVRYSQQIIRTTGSDDFLWVEKTSPPSFSGSAKNNDN